MTEKKKDEVVPADVREMADLYTQLESLLTASKMELKPTSEDLQKMVVSLFIHRADSGSLTSAPAAPASAPASAPAQTPADKGKYPDRECPNCHIAIGVRFGKDSGKPYYKCVKCNSWINDDGSATPAKPPQRK